MDKSVKKVKKFKIFGTTWTVQYKDVLECEEGHFLFGQTDLVSKTIYIATKDREGNLMPEREMALTFLHEVMHAIMLEGQYFNSSDDEPLVEWLAKCLISLKEQKVL